MEENFLITLSSKKGKFNFLNRRIYFKRIKELEACTFFQQIIAGVEYIHHLKIVHRQIISKIKKNYNEKI